MKKPERPSSVLVIAILQICFGSLGLLFNLCGGAMQAAGGAKMFAPPPGAAAQAPPDVEAMMQARVPYYKAYQMSALALGVVAGAVMLVGGIGLVKMRPWARPLTIGYACYNIVITIVGFVMNVIVNGPVMKEVYAELRKDPNIARMGGLMDITEAAATIMAYGSLVLLVYPIVLLTVMFLPSVREAFRAAGSPGPDEEAYDDEE